jgi:hypothetical protein
VSTERINAFLAMLDRGQDRVSQATVEETERLTEAS